VDAAADADNFESLAPMVYLEIASQVAQAMVFLRSMLYVTHRRLTMDSVYVMAFDTQDHQKIRVKVGSNFDLFPFSLQTSETTSNPDENDYADDSFENYLAAPEVQARGHYSEASDVWAFGVLLWDLYSINDPSSVEIFSDLLSDGTLTSIVDPEKVSSPKYCPEFVFDTLIRPCFKKLYPLRPSFHKLNKSIRVAQERILREQGAVEAGAHKTCCVCLIRRANVAIFPCGHLCLCTDCHPEFPLEDSTCPMCRGNVEDLFAIYE
jgi:serine/threonine protein kinase